MEIKNGITTIGSGTGSATGSATLAAGVNVITVKVTKGSEIVTYEVDVTKS